MAHCEKIIAAKNEQIRASNCILPVKNTKKLEIYENYRKIT